MLMFRGTWQTCYPLSIPAVPAVCMNAMMLQVPLHFISLSDTSAGSDVGRGCRRGGRDLVVVAYRPARDPSAMAGR